MYSGSTVPFRLPHRIILLCALALAACAAPAHAATPITFSSPEFESRTVVSGLTQPSAVDWTPDGRMVIAEKFGGLAVAQPGSSTATVVKDLSNQVNTAGDRGLLGVAVDANYATNHYVYLLYTHEVEPLTPDSDDAMNSQLMRVQLSATNVVSDQTVILGANAASPCPSTPANDVDCIPSDSLSHSIGTVRADPDGTLWVGSGDGSDFGGVDPRAFRSYDERSPAGKIMHIDHNGHGLPGHAFCPSDTDLTHVCTKLYGKGFRNPFRFNFRKGGGLVVGDVGWNAYEELDLIGEAGHNWGWPCREGTHSTPGYKDRPECPPADPTSDPVYDYSHNNTEAAIVGGPEYEGDGYPASYKDSIFFGDYPEGYIKRLVPNGTGGYTAQDFAAHLSPAEGHALVFLGTAPDNGDLIYADMGNFTSTHGSIKRISYAPDNRAPSASASASPPYGKPVPLQVHFDGSTSSDPDGDTLSYEWDFGDGSPTATTAEADHTYTTAGTYTATLTVSDGGKTDSTSIRIDAGNTPPQFSAPATAGSYRDGQQVSLSAAASDEEDGGALGPSAFHWDVRLIHINHTHPYPSFDNVDTIQFTPGTDHDADSHFEVTVTATDSNGLSATRQVRLDPETTSLALRSSPEGAPLSYGGRAHTSPFDGVTAIGFQTTVTAPASFTSGGRSWVFSSWSDGQSRIHDLTVPSAPLSLTARYSAVSTTKPKPKPKPPAADHTGPRLSFSALKKGVLRGRVSDPAGVRKVYVGFGKRSSRRRKCRWWYPSKRRLGRRYRRCNRPVWIKAKVSKGRWRASLRRKRLPAGAYRVLFGALDKKGNESLKLSNGRALARVTVHRRRR